ncbi:hypothetical protein ACFL2P_02995, partial [Candidatus Moduliflexota bacterium]
MKEFEESGTGATASVRRVGTILAVVVVAAVIVFSLGVMVGKRVTGGGQASEPPSALPTENLRPRPSQEAGKKAESRPAPEAQGAKSGKDPLSSEKLTFFDTLSGDKAAAPPVLPKEKAPPVKKADLEKKAAPPPPKKRAASPEARVMAMAGPGQYYVQVASTTNS